MADNLTPKEEFLLNPVEEHNITDAAIASFETNFKHPVKVIVPITPVQDLHGYDHPWPAGGSVNLIPDGTDTSNGYVEKSRLDSDGSIISNDNYCYVSEYFEVEPGATYTQTGKNYGITAAGRYFCFYDENKEFISSIETTLVANTFTSPSTAKWCRSTQGYTSFLVQIEKGSTASAIVPYSNVCPIEGSIGGKINGVGKNLLDPNTFSTTKSSSYISYWSAIHRPENTTLVWTFEDNDTSIELPSDSNMLLRTKVGNTSNVYKYLIQNGQLRSDANGYESAQFTAVAWSKYNQTALDYIAKIFQRYKIMCRVKGTDDTYEPFSGISLPISWKHAEGTYNFEPIQAGEGDPSPENVRPISPALTLTRDDNSVLTVYGGSITFRDDGTSRLIVNQDVYLLNSVDQIYSYPWCNGLDGAKAMLGKCLPKSQEDYALSGMAQLYISDSRIFRNNVNASLREDQFSCYRAVVYGVSVGFNPQIVGETKAELGAYLSENPITFVYPLLHPETYTLSVSETQRVIDALGDKVTTTIYGGTVTLNEDGSADVVSEQFIFDLGKIQLTRYGEKAWTNGSVPKLKLVKSPSYNDVLIACTAYNTSTPKSILSDGIDKSIWMYAANNNAKIIIRNDDYVVDGLCDVNALSKSLQGVLVCGLLETPVTYHFPNVGQLKAFLGQNNIWSDIGNVNVKYLTQNSATGLEYRGDRALELRRRAMIGDAPTIHTTVGSEETGGLASFKSYIKAPVKKIEIPFSPKQDLHGYDHPWPGGGGKNLLNPNDPDYGNYTIAPDGSETAGSTRISTGFIPCIVGTAYTLSGIAGASNGNRVFGFAGIAFYDINKTYLSRVFGNDVNTITATAPADAVYMRYFEEMPKVNPATPQAFVTYKRQLEAGSTATAWVPYENICPIEGHDGCETTHTGKNLVDGETVMNILRNAKPSQVVFGEDEHGKYAQITNCTGAYVNLTPSIKFKSNTAYTLMFYADSGYYTHITMKYTDGNALEFTNASGKYQTLCGVTNPVKTLDHIDIVTRTGTNKIYYETFGLFEGSVLEMDFKPYTGTTLPLTFNQSGGHAFLPIQEGTGDPSPENVRPINPGLTFTRDDDSVLSVYGGTLTVNEDGSGDLTSTYAFYEFDGSQDETWNDSSYSGHGGVEYPSRSKTTVRSCGIAAHARIEDARLTGGKSSYLVINVGNNLYFGNAVGFSLYYGELDVSINGVYSVSDLRAYLQDNPLQITYKLATPDTYTLSVAETNRALEALGLTQHIGSIYGGTVTINPDGSADVVKSFGVITLNGTQTISYFPWTQSGNVVSALFQKSAMPQNADTQAPYDASCSRCDRLEFTPDIANGGRKIGVYGFYSIANSYGPAIVLDSNIVGTTRAELNAWLASNPITITYKLQSPVSYHFSNLEQLKVWLGENNFWCDISDDITVKYWNRG